MEAAAGVGRVVLQVAGGGLDRPLLTAGPVPQAIGAGVGDPEPHLGPGQ